MSLWFRQHSRFAHEKSEVRRPISSEVNCLRNICTYGVLTTTCVIYIMECKFVDYSVYLALIVT